MDEVVVARHGESEASSRGIVGGDTALTERGREQAEELGRQLSSDEFDLCLTSPAKRALETARLALSGRDTPVAVESELRDIEFGQWEGRPLEEYRRWVAGHSPTEAVRGGESRAATLSRIAGAFRGMLDRRERRLLVVAHGITVSALRDERPRPVVDSAPPGGSVRLTRSELEAAVDRLERWCESAAW